GAQARPKALPPVPSNEDHSPIGTKPAKLLLQPAAQRSIRGYLAAHDLEGIDDRIARHDDRLRRMTLLDQSIAGAPGGCKMPRGDDGGEAPVGLLGPGARKGGGCAALPPRAPP